ncbi:MAG: SGNH/GDSL hydrolase family protein [Sphingomicrobium sp.]
MHTVFRARLAGLAAILLCLGAAPAQRWTSAWATAQQAYQGDNSQAEGAFEDVTLRQLVRTSVGGRQLRIRISNAFGTDALLLSGVNIALAPDPASPKILRGSDRPLTFSRARQVAVPAGAEYVSDPVDLDIPPLATLAVSMHILKDPKSESGHVGSRATSYIVKGDQLSASDLPGAKTVDHWYNLTAIDVTGGRGAIAILGDSITDGNGVQPNTNQRWPDFLMERLQASPRTRGLSILNLGIGGNRLLNDGIGPNALARFDRDVLRRSNVRYLIILEGVNDLGTLTREAPVSAGEHTTQTQRMIAAYRQMVARAREHGIKVIGATVMPYGSNEYYHPAAVNEADRQAINAWIRKPGNFDAVIDFDRLVRDPAHPERLLAAYDKGDGIHPSIAGYRLMAEAVPLSLFSR